MRFPLCAPFTALLMLAAAPFPNTVLGQALSIIKKADTNYWIEASAPAGDPHTLQASENLHLWINVHDAVQDSYSFQFDNAGVSQRYFRLISSPPPPPPIRVLIIGDSMAADCCGWGRGIYGYFNANATVVNYATPWTSTKVFLQSAEWEKMLLIKPDYVLIQYGYIDGGTDLDRYTTLDEFAENLRTIVKAVRDFNGVPILVTLHAARLWDANGKLIPVWQDRNAVTMALATELKTPLVDLYQSTAELFSKLGPTGTAFMHWDGGDADDFMHFSQLGGVWVSRLVVNALPDSLGPYMTRIFDPPPQP